MNVETCKKELYKKCESMMTMVLRKLNNFLCKLNSNLGKKCVDKEK